MVGGGVDLVRGVCAVGASGLFVAVGATSENLPEDVLRLRPVRRVGTAETVGDGTLRRRV